jgi:PAS domain S-box-containing protein
MDNLKHLLADSELLLNAAGEGIYGFDLEGKAVFINPAAERMTGWQAGELLGEKIHQYHHHSHADGTPYPAHECNIYATMQDGQERSISHEVFWRKDGSSFPVEYTSTPVYKDGKIIGAVAIFRDVTEQQESDRALREALAQVQALSEQLQAENTYLQSEIDENWSDSGLVGQSPRFKQLLEQVSLVSKTDSTVLILGENGTGKELIARNIHRLSKRAHNTLVKVNCAAFTPSLLESELFGHEKGAFTGATERRKGRFELADKGTLFLDEVGELSLEAQSKLLRVLQEQEFERVGGNQTLKVDIRVIAATNKDLLKMVQQGEFRMDLYYRLNVFPLTMPALRERLDDLPFLCQNIISELARKLGKPIKGISKASLKRLATYHWPGNIRELQNVLEREVILSQTSLIQIKHDFQANLDASNFAQLTLAEMEKSYIEQVLEQCAGKIGGVNGAAKLLDLPESTLRSKMKKLGISRI